MPPKKTSGGELKQQIMQQINQINDNNILGQISKLLTNDITPTTPTPPIPTVSGGKKKIVKKDMSKGKPVKKTKAGPNSWMKALQEYNKDRKANKIICTIPENQKKSWDVPKKGTKEYDYVIKIKKEIDAKM